MRINLYGVEALSGIRSGEEGVIKLTIPEIQYTTAWSSCQRPTRPHQIGIYVTSHHLAQAHRTDTQLVVILLDTPGGLDPLRAVIGDILLDDVLAKREQINQVLRVKLDEVTGRWGVKVTTVEIREILPPKEVQNAMNRQLAAERERRATVIQAEGERQATILRTEGDRQATILWAEGFSLALEKIYCVARTIDDKTMSLQYLETLKALGLGPATKFVLPMEFTNLLRPFLSHTDHALSTEPNGVSLKEGNHSQQDQ